MNVGVVHARRPFAPGPADAAAAALARALEARGHGVASMLLPFAWDTPEQLVEQVLAMRMLRVGNLDRLIAVSFPAGCISHTDKVVWQFDGAGQAGAALPATPLGDEARAAVARAERQFLGDARGVFASTRDEADRLRGELGRDVEVLEPPAAPAAWDDVAARLAS